MFSFYFIFSSIVMPFTGKEKVNKTVQCAFEREFDKNASTAIEI